MNKLVSAATLALFALALLPVNVRAQLIPDRSLGNENSRIINDTNRDLIDGGARRGINLFHSFQEFNVNLGGSVYFVNPAGVENILTRVTGSNSSQILGTLGVLGNANLFLINPNGILFGEGASLDLQGAFIATTADRVSLGNRGNFSASDPNSSSLLNIKPDALFFNALAANQNNITVRGNLESNLGQTIGLFGDNILIDGGRLETDSGQIFLGAVNSGAIDLDIDNNFIAYSQGSNFGNIQLTARARLRANTRNLNGKGVNIAANNLLINENSQISADTSGTGNGGAINITANNSVEIRDAGSQIEAEVRSTASGNGGSIKIDTNILKVLNQADIQARTSGAGNGGTIDIKADLIELSGSGTDIRADINNSATTTAIGGKIIIDTNILRVLNQADIQVRNSGAGNARDPNNLNEDNIFIRANLIEVSGSGADIRADVNEGSSGNGGNIRIETDILRISDTGDIQLDTRGAGDAGNLIINARSIELISGGGIEADVGNLDRVEVTGRGGNIIINTDTLSISKSLDLPENPRSEIAVDNFGRGDVGTLTINANSIVLDNGFISSRTRFIEKGGDINLNVNRLLSLRNGSEIRTESTLAEPGAGDGGNITINSPFIVAFPRDNLIIADAEAPEARGGNITISTRAIFGFPQFLAIDASGGGGELGIDGTINIDTSDISPGSIIRQLQTNPIDAAAIVDRDLCQLRNGKIARGSSFIVTGKGGLPPTPSTPIDSYDNLLDWVDLQAESDKANLKPVIIDRDRQIPNSEVAFIEARGWIKRADGAIVLTDRPVAGVNSVSNLVPANCLRDRE